MERIFENVHNAYFGVLGDVLHNYDYKCAPRGQEIREILNYSFTIQNPVSEPVKTKDLERNKKIADYTEKELEVYMSGSNKAKDYAKIASMWEKIANRDGTVNSAYGYLIFHNKSHGNALEWSEEELLSTTSSSFMRTPWEFAKQSLINDKDTRQATLRFQLPEHCYIGNKDVTCTLHGQFCIREDKLHFSVIMRSNDVFFGLVYDLPFFIKLLEKMTLELKPYYPKLQVGTYTHLSHSMHMYMRNEKAILKMMGEEV